MSKSAFINQACQKIRRLIAQEKLKEAYTICQGFLQEYPNEDDLLMLAHGIEVQVDENNQKIVDEKLKDLAKLWKEEKYSEIITELKKLLKASPENSKLIEQFERAKSSYKKQVDTLQSNFFKGQRERLEKILRDQPDELQSALYILESNNQNNLKIKALSKEYKDKLIKKRIKERSALLKSGKSEEISNFIQGLKKIDKENEELKKLEQSSKIQTHKSQLNKKEEYIYEGMTKFDDLMKLGEYDHAITVADEILKIEPKYQPAQKAKKRAERNFYFHTKRLVIKEIAMLNKKQKKSYKENPSEFIKL
jgi:hypothetical protein